MIDNNTVHTSIPVLLIEYPCRYSTQFYAFIRRINTQNQQNQQILLILLLRIRLLRSLLFLRILLLNMDLANILNRSSPPPPPSLSTPFSSPPSPPPSPSHQTTRDQRLQVQILREIGWTYGQICNKLQLTHNQVRYAISHRLTPQKRSGRPSKLTQEEVDHIISWVCASKAHRRTPWVQISILLKLNVSYYSVRTALRKAGFVRRVARRKPPISERNRQARL
jgi:Transposase